MHESIDNRTVGGLEHLYAMYVPGIAIPVKNNADRVATLLCCEKRRHVSDTARLVCVMALLLDGYFTPRR